jgi:essential nuclear protein 1
VLAKTSLLAQLGDDELQAKYGRVSQPGKRKKQFKNNAGEDDSSEVFLFHGDSAARF